jgi:hypothetical protein
MGEARNAHNILVGKSEGKSSLGRSRYGYEENIKMYLMETECKGVIWIHLAQDRKPSF